MKWIQTTVKHAAIFDDSATPTKIPGEESMCLKVGNDLYMPVVRWMKYDSKTEIWTEIEMEEEEGIMEMQEEDGTFKVKSLDIE